MKRILLISIAVLAFMLLLIALAGMYKFNYLAGQSGYDVDGNRISSLTEKEARTIAERSCIKGGAALSDGSYNEMTKTWWFDANLNATREGCNPACVVTEETKTAEVNWRCTGL